MGFSCRKITASPGTWLSSQGLPLQRSQFTAVSFPCPCPLPLQVSIPHWGNLEEIWIWFEFHRLSSWVLISSASCWRHWYKGHLQISQPRHYWHIELENSLLWETGLCLIGRLAASLASTPWMPVIHPPVPVWQSEMSLDIAKCPLEAKSFPAENHPVIAKKTNVFCHLWWTRCVLDVSCNPDNSLLKSSPLLIDEEPEGWQG